MNTYEANPEDEFDLDRDEDESGAETPDDKCCACDVELEEYYTVGGASICPSCKTEIDERLVSGSGLARFVKAMIGGGFFAAIGCGIYYAILALTGFHIGLVAIVVGYLVGTGVRWGTGGRGGWRYQALAIILTYIAISLTNLPDLIAEFAQDPALPQDQPMGPLSVADIAIALVAIVLFVLALPVFIGFESPIYLLIVCYALYEAGKLNKRSEPMIEGPFRRGEEIGGVQPVM